MALDAISGAAYNDTAKLSQKIKTDTGVSLDSGTVNININELPDTIKTSSGSQTGSDQDKGQREPSASSKQIKDAISQANSKMRQQSTRCEFAYHDDINRVSIKVIDKDTDEVIKEIPSEDTLAMIEKLLDLAGLLIDEKR